MNVDMMKVQMILQGSQNIDRMRVEISCLISMLIGMISDKQRESILNGHRFSLSFVESKAEGTCCFWRIEVSLKEIEVAFYLGSWSRRVYNFEGQWENPKYVEVVYDQLPKLLELFVQTFPHLVEKLEPFIKAAEVKF